MDHRRPNSALGVLDEADQAHKMNSRSNADNVDVNDEVGSNKSTDVGQGGCHRYAQH